MYFFQGNRVWNCLSRQKAKWFWVSDVPSTPLCTRARSASWAARLLHRLMLCSNHLTAHFGELLQTDECIRSTDIMQSSSKVHSHVHVNLFACKNLSRSDLIYGFSSAKRISEMFIQFHRERHCMEGEKINLFPLQPWDLTYLSLSKSHDVKPKHHKPSDTEKQVQALC